MLRTLASIPHEVVDLPAEPVIHCPSAGRVLQAGFHFTIGIFDLSRKPGCVHSRWKGDGEEQKDGGCRANSDSFPKDHLAKSHRWQNHRNLCRERVVGCLDTFFLYDRRVVDGRWFVCWAISGGGWPLSVLEADHHRG